MITYKNIDTTVIKQRNGAYFLPRWKAPCNNRNINGVTTIFIRATRTNSQLVIQEQVVYHQSVIVFLCSDVIQK